MHFLLVCIRFLLMYKKSLQKLGKGIVLVYLPRQFSNMRQIFLILALFIITLTTQAQSIGIGTTTPDPSAQLDVFSTDKGLLIPRIALTATNVASPVVNPATGLLVYNTDSAGADPYKVIPGFYYWNGTQWYPVVNKGKAPGDMQYWDGTKWVSIPVGAHGSVLTLCNGVPRWGSCDILSVTLTPQPQFQGMIDSYHSSAFDWPSDMYLDIAAWTNGGNPETRRALIKFDLAAIPANATIDSARLYLYTNPNPPNGNGVDANFGAANAGWVQRITSPWTVWNQYYWYNQPSVTSVNQVAIPQSTSSTSNADMLVTNLVKDMITSGNNGFHLRLQTEATYNIRQWGGGAYPDPTRRPKLVVWYH